MQQAHSPSSAFLTPPSLLAALVQNWSLVLLRGVAALLFGVLTFVWPALPLTSLVALVGAYAFAYGVLLIAFALRLRKHAHAA